MDCLSGARQLRLGLLLQALQVLDDAAAVASVIRDARRAGTVILVAARGGALRSGREALHVRGVSCGGLRHGAESLRQCVQLFATALLLRLVIHCVRLAMVKRVILGDDVLLEGL